MDELVDDLCYELAVVLRRILDLDEMSEYEETETVGREGRAGADR